MPSCESNGLTATMYNSICDAAPHQISWVLSRASLNIEHMYSPANLRNPIHMEPPPVSLYKSKYGAVKEDALQLNPMRPSPCETGTHDKLMAILPPKLKDAICEIVETSATKTIYEVRLDVGMPPRIAIAESVTSPPSREGQPSKVQHVTRTLCVSTAKVTDESDIRHIISSDDVIVSDESKNRMCIRGTLHRVSVLVESKGPCDIATFPCRSLTIRVGRHVPDAARILADIILNEKCGSVLLLGSPGSGKTTILRSMVLIAAGNAADGFNPNENVFVIDTSNELAPDDPALRQDILGYARSIHTTKARQHDTMAEVLMNHFPTIMAIDEISPDDTHVLRRVTSSGVRVFATAHASSLFDAMQLSSLAPLLGGTQTVTRGDAMMVATAGLQRKTTQERMGEPYFQTVIQITDDGFLIWQGRHHLNAALDTMLAQGDARFPSRDHGAPQHRTWPPGAWRDQKNYVDFLIGIH